VDRRIDVEMRLLVGYEGNMNVKWLHRIERTDPFRSAVPIDPDHPFRAIPISVWRSVSGTVG
jgi:hypothetical protein